MGLTKQFLYTFSKNIFEGTLTKLVVLITNPVTDLSPKIKPFFR